MLNESKWQENVAHAFHAAEHTEVGKQAIHATGAALVGAAVAAAPALIVVAPIALISWGLWKCFGAGKPAGG